MLYSGVSWAMNLLTHLFHYFFLLSYHHFSSFLYIYILCSILWFCHHISFYAMSDDLLHFNAWRTIISLSPPISWTLVRRSLVEKVILSKRVCLHHCLRVYTFHYVFSDELIYWYSEYVQVKKMKWKRKKEKKKKKVIRACIYVCIQCHFLLSVYIGQWGLLLWVSCLWEFVCELSDTRFSLCLFHYVFLRVRDKWPFPRDSGSLSSPSLHTLVI